MTTTEKNKITKLIVNLVNELELTFQEQALILDGCAFCDSSNNYYLFNINNINQLRITRVNSKGSSRVLYKTMTTTNENHKADIIDLINTLN